MDVLHLVLWTLVLVGHAALWVCFFNRLHAWAVSRWVIEATEKAYLAVIIFGGGVWLWWGWFSPGHYWPDRMPDLMSMLEGRPVLTGYSALCGLFALHVIAQWLRRQARGVPAQLVRNHTQRWDIAAELAARPTGDRLARLLDCIPGNQMFLLDVHEKELQIAALPRELDGFTIAHVSDLHFTGHIQRPYFEAVIQRTLDLDADLIAVTGDLVDHSRCIDWLEPTLGRLRARAGVYFLLGNHDLQHGDPPRTREILTRCGLIDVGGRCVSLEFRGCRLLLAGDERPWFRDEPEVERCLAEWQPDFHVLLAHTPDQLAFARRHNFPLMLAGHTHGGQIRFPLIGPVVAPSRFGVRYAGGVFYEPPTLMHVTRGISGKDPIRINCSPELDKLILRCAP